MSEAGGYRNEHTLPWAPENFAVYRGQRLIAHSYEGYTLVYFPGGAIKRLGELPGIVPPLKIRPRLLVA